MIGSAHAYAGVKHWGLANALGMQSTQVVVVVVVACKDVFTVVLGMEHGFPPCFIAAKHCTNN